MSDEQRKDHVCLCEGCGRKFTADWIDIAKALREDKAVICAQCYQKLAAVMSKAARKK
jgi:hypothetical protein